jgi:hypothetical protein
MDKQEDEKQSAEYLSGFNQGYELAQKLPDLAEKVTQALQDKDDDRAKGIKDGRNEMMLERTRDRLADKGANREPTAPEKDPAKDQDIGPER